MYFDFQDLENAPSCDAVVRERISKLPPEIADVSLLSQLKGYYYFVLTCPNLKICIILKKCICTLVIFCNILLEFIIFVKI